MNIEVSNLELDGDAQTVSEGLVFSYIVGGDKVESDYVADVYSKG
jgi:hypothetical protein